MPREGAFLAEIRLGVACLVEADRHRGVHLVEAFPVWEGPFPVPRVCQAPLEVALQLLALTSAPTNG
jgi:hypothetical protein